MKIVFKGITKECRYYKGLEWNKPLTPKMKQFEKETNKKAVFRNVVTGGFEYWMYWRSNIKQNVKQNVTPIIKDLAKITNYSLYNFLILLDAYDISYSERQTKSEDIYITFKMISRWNGKVNKFELYIPGYGAMWRLFEYRNTCRIRIYAGKESIFSYMTDTLTEHSSRYPLKRSSELNIGHNVKQISLLQKKTNKTTEIN